LISAFSGKKLYFEKDKESLIKYDEDRERQVLNNKKSSSLRGLNATAADCNKKHIFK